MKRLITTSIALVMLTGLGTARLSERQRAQHALNRLAFGARPGDVDRVLEIGVDKWVQQQIHPESISDRAMQARLDRFETLTMSDAQILTKYYVPVIEARKAKKNAAEGGGATLRDEIPFDRRPARVVAELNAQRILLAVAPELLTDEVWA